ncbi:hypothetical protein [Acidithiobacillus sp. IBUN Pt1247-S3]|uniref:hypothetical protein n=1 Tax=Acidithiobacillus sp. IBUN Pt1247-S3 TaxID=3166642 RepID=UPI0034E3DEAE
MAWREVIKQAVREVVLHPERAPLDAIAKCLSTDDLGADKENVEALVMEELRRLHEGVLARYGLRPSEFAEWRSRQR